MNEKKLGGNNSDTVIKYKKSAIRRTMINDHDYQSRITYGKLAKLLF